MKRTKTIPVFCTLTATITFLAAVPHHANAGMEPFVGEINYVAFNFAPQGWLQCDGQILSINQYQALYALIGTAYGGDGVSNFKLPDLRGKVPVHQGGSPGFSVYNMGQTSGAENVTLTAAQMPMHTHSATAISTSTSAVAPGATATSTLKAVNTDANQKNAGGNALANAKGSNSAYSSAAPNVNMNAASIETTLSNLGIATTTNTTVNVSPAGNSQPFSIMQPYTVINCIIAWEGVFPQRP